MNPTSHEPTGPRRPTVLPCGKFQGCQIVLMSTDDLIAARREFSRVDPTVQGAIMSELARRERSAVRKRMRGSLRCLPQRSTEQGQS